MKRALLLLGITFFVIAAYAQPQVGIDSVKNYEGQIVKVCTKVYGGKYLESVKGSPTLINCGANYPNALLTILIWGDKRGNFKNPPEKYYTDKTICVIGKVVIYKGSPEIIVNNENQIEVQTDSK
jgi:hypothetical protein